MPKPTTFRHTKLYLVVASFWDARTESKVHGDLSSAKATAAEWRVRFPDAHVQTHEIWQSLPEGK